MLTAYNITIMKNYVTEVVCFIAHWDNSHRKASLQYQTHKELTRS